MISFALRRMLQGVAGWWYLNALASVDFFNDRYMQNRVPVAKEPALTFARASKFVAKDAAEFYQEFAANALARSNDLGAYIGAAFTNKIRNPRGEGGVVGTVGVTNKCTGYNAKPPALVAMGTAAAFNSAVTNMTASGGDANTLFGVVDDTAALQAIAATDPFIAAGLTNGWLNGRVYKIDNSAGAAEAIISCSGVSGNTNAHSAQAYVRGGDGYILIYPRTVGAPVAFTPSAAYVKRKIENSVPTTTGGTRVAAYAGSVVYFILFSLIEASVAAPVPTVVAGASASGSLPTNWGYNTAGIGLTTQNLGVGTRYGMPYTRIRFSGVALATGKERFYFETGSNIAVTAGQAWGEDLWVERLSGALEINSRIIERANTNLDAGLRTVEGAAHSGNTFQRIYSTAVIADPTATNIAGSIRLSAAGGGNIVNGQSYDTTFDIFAPKAVQLVTPGYMPAFPILPPPGAPGNSTKAADGLSYTSMAWYVARGLEDAASMLIIPNWSHSAIGAVRPLFEHAADPNSYILGYINESGFPALKIVSGGVIETDTPLPYAIAVTRAPLLFGWSASGGYIVDSAGHLATFGAVTLPTGLTAGRIGSSQAGLYLEDTLEYVETHQLLAEATAIALAAAA